MKRICLLVASAFMTVLISGCCCSNNFKSFEQGFNQSKNPVNNAMNTSIAAENVNIDDGSLQVVSGQSFQNFKIGESLADLKEEIYQGAFKDWKFNHLEQNQWNYTLEPVNDNDLTISFAVKDDVVKGILVHQGYTACENLKHQVFTVDGQKVVFDETDENALKKMFPENDSYSYGVFGYLNIPEGIDFHLYGDECNQKRKETIVKSIVIFEKNNDFLYNVGNDEGI